MAEAVAKVARKVNELVESGGHHLDLSDCALNCFPTGLYLVMSTVADKIFSISLANNELKNLSGKFFTTFERLQELNLEGNSLEKLPHEVCLLLNLKMINVARNKLVTFPDELTKIQCIKNINLEGNQIKGKALFTSASGFRSLVPSHLVDYAIKSAKKNGNLTEQRQTEIISKGSVTIEINGNANGKLWFPFLDSLDGKV